MNITTLGTLQFNVFLEFKYEKIVLPTSVTIYHLRYLIEVLIPVNKNIECTPTACKTERSI